jgi:hypothetical protein
MEGIKDMEMFVGILLGWGIATLNYVLYQFIETWRAKRIPPKP